MFNFLSLMESQEGIVPYDVPLIGEKTLARQSDLGKSEVQTIDLTFQRCYAVVHLSFINTSDYSLYGEDLVAYAQKIDMRLQNEVCDKWKNRFGR
ncbi:MAG: hypothetical protein A2136_11100 [Chloroflexi bacterium RBG_16_54_11]|nr:MAG: hypothetical protein A2136_11100 [Chloroflexi bacterium RBG_16_54_11]